MQRVELNFDEIAGVSGIADEYAAWNSRMPIVPRSSRLYHLSPIGLKTPMVESLTGYIVRLADAHCVSAGVLYWKEIRAVAGKGNIFTFRVASDEGYSTHSINSFGSPAADFVRALESLTGRSDLRYLTLLPWAEVLTHFSLLRRSRVWCESCLYAWQHAGQPIYEPLLWALQPVTVCPYHRCRLRQVCPSCQNQIGPLDSRSRSGHCSRCGRTLVPNVAGRAVDGQIAPDAEMIWADWVANALGELLAAAPEIRWSPERMQLAETIRLCVDQTSSGNASAFARLMNVGRGDVIRWQKGKARPRLLTLLNMAYRRGISLLELLKESPISDTSRVFVRPALLTSERTTKRPRTRHSWRIDIEGLSQSLRLALKEDPPPSVYQVIKRLQCNEVTVRRHFPELCAELARHYAKYRVKRAVARKMQAAEEVRRVALDLHEKGINLTRKNIRPLLRSSDYLNLEEGRAALREIQGKAPRFISLSHCGAKLRGSNVPSPTSCFTTVHPGRG